MRFCDAGKLLYRLTILFYLVSYAITVASAGLPYSKDRIWVLESGKDPYTLPYNGETSMPRMSVYRGIIRNIDGTPAAYAGLYAQVSPAVKKSDGPVQTFVSGIELNAGADGRFQYGLKDYAHHGITMTGRDSGNVFSRSQEGYQLELGKENIIVSRQIAEVPAQLIKADGTVLHLNDPPEVYSTPDDQTTPGEKLATISPTISKLRGSPPGPVPLLKKFGRYSSLATLRSLPPSKPYADAELNISDQSTTTPFILRRLAVPGHYSMLALGRVFKPFHVATTTTEITVYEDARPFTLSGTVTDPLGNPIEGAFIRIDNGRNANWIWNEPQYDTMRQLWEITAGDFNTLGFYLARTDANGHYNISGSCVGSFSTIYGCAKGFGRLKTHVFLPQNATPNSAATSPETTGPLHESDTPGFSDMMFEGTATIPPFTMARTATVKVRLSDDDGPILELPGRQPLNFVSVDTSFYWSVDFNCEEGISYFTVPAQVPFQLKFAATAKKGATATITVTTPLAPGETRDLGSHKLNFQPPVR